MKSYRELSGRYLKSQKKRTILTIAGVVLSVSLLCAAGIMGESFRNMMVDNIKHQYGNYHVEFGGISEAQTAKLQKNVKAAEVGSRMDVGLDRISDTQNILITACDRNFLDMHYIELSTGRLPEKENEIALEQWIVDNMKEKPSVGDIVRLDFNTKALTLGSADGKNDASGEFKLAGIFRNNTFTQYSGLSIGMVTVQTAKALLREDNPEVNAVVRIKDGLPLQATINEMTSGIGADSKRVHKNSAMLTIQSQGMNDRANKAVIIVQGILMLVIIIATISVIYNAFHISVLERIHQFGVLRSVGTTPRQIRMIVLGEACAFGAVGIPLGIALGVLGVKVVIGFFSLQSAAFFGSMSVVVHPRTLLITVALGLATLLASAFGPSITAGRVSPMEAILNTSKTNRVMARRKKHPIISRIFRVEGVMAYENLKRNRKRFFVTVFSMCIGIVLFIFFSFFMSLMYQGTNTSFQKDFAMDKPFSSGGPGYTQADYDEIAGISGVKTVYRVMQEDQQVLLTGSQADKKFTQAVSGKKADYSYTMDDTEYYSLTTDFYGYRERELNLCKPDIIRGRLDIAEMDRENGVLVSQIAHVNGNIMGVSQLKPGDEIAIVNPYGKGPAAKPVKLKVVGILDTMPISYTAGPEKYGIITTESVFRKITGKDTYSRFDIELSGSADKKALSGRLGDIAKRVKDGRLLDFSDDQVSEIKMEMSVILYGLVIVISIIGALNIINTISTNLILRTREFGILRAVGMTPGQITGMIRLEGIFYGLISAFYGSIIGCALAWLMYYYSDIIRSMTWHLPWRAAVEAALAAIIIGLAASAAPLKRITRLNVVESIRAEE